MDRLGAEQVMVLVRVGFQGGRAGGKNRQVKDDTIIESVCKKELLQQYLYK